MSSDHGKKQEDLEGTQEHGPESSLGLFNCEATVLKKKTAPQKEKD